MITFLLQPLSNLIQSLAMKAKEYKAFKHFGPGGISCPCCTPFNSGKKNRQMANRAFRRQSKKQIDSGL